MRSKRIWCIMVVLTFMLPVNASAARLTREEIIGRTREPAGREANAERQERLVNVKGTLLEIQRFDLSGVGESHLFAKMKTRAGRIIRVDLGPASQLEGFGLEEGLAVSVYGLQGTVNERPMLVAMGLETPAREDWIRRPRDMNLRRFEVRILNTRVAGYEEYDIPDQLLARAGMGEGETILVVNLGPAANFPEDVSLEGEEVFLLARPARIGGKMALIAEEVYTEGGRLIDIDWTRP